MESSDSTNESPDSDGLSQRQMENTSTCIDENETQVGVVVKTIRVDIPENHVECHENGNISACEEEEDGNNCMAVKEENHTECNEKEKILDFHRDVDETRDITEKEDAKNHSKKYHLVGSAQRELSDGVQTARGHTMQDTPDASQEKDNHYPINHSDEIDKDLKDQSPSGNNSLPDEDDETLHAHEHDVRRREVIRHLSYHDSDSDLIDYDYDDGRSIPDVDSDIDSWDWTFPDENVNEIDARRVPLTPHSTRHLSNISESTCSEAEDELSDSTAEIDPEPIVSSIRQDSDTKDCQGVETPGVFEYSDTEEAEEIAKSVTESHNVTLPKRSLSSDRPKLYHDDKRKQVGREENVVYFEDLKSSQVLKTRLKYLYDNSYISSATSRVRNNRKQSKVKETQKKKSIITEDVLRRQIARKQFEYRNKLKPISKLDALESKFFNINPSYLYEDEEEFPPPVNVYIDSPVSELLMSSMLSGSISRSDLTLPRVVPNNQRRASLPGKRPSLNDSLSERLIQWRLNRGRAMSKPDVFRKSLTKEQIQRDVDDLMALKRRRQRNAFERFRHAGRMILLMLRAVGLKPVKKKEDNYNYLSWTVMYDEVLGISRLSYDHGNLSFDPLLYKANKELTIGDDIKEILRLPTDQRSDPQIQAVLYCFQQVVPSFSEFPIRIQQSMVKVCTYERFETGRVIIRQGHRAENFYFILSGCAVVTEMESNANHVHTTNVLGKGNSFGELAFLNMSKRSATVICREDVELICIEREDFIDIFMRKVKGKEPEHITFLKKVELLKEWPVWLLPHDNPKICAFTYVRRGVILCHDSDKSDWLVVIVSGSCKILKALNDKPVRTFSEDGRQAAVETHRIKLAAPTSSFSKIYTATSNNSNQNNINGRVKRHHCLEEQQQQHQRQQPHRRIRRHGTVTANPRISLDTTHSLGGSQDQDVDLDLAQIEHLAQINSIYYQKHVLPSIHKMKREEAQDKNSRKTSTKRLEPPPATSVFRPKRQSYGLQPPALPQLVVPESRPSQKKVFIEITRLEPGDIFGLEHVLLHGMRDVTSCSLVSEGAEVVLISKKFFKKHLTEETAKKIRQLIRPLPSEKTLQQNLNTKKSWEAYKAYTVARHAHGKDRAKAPLLT